MTSVTVSTYGFCVTAPRRTQAQRRQTTRARLLDAAVQCLIERGYAETTTSQVQAFAEVSRGTLLHHFPTKVDLLVGAVRHLAQRRLEEFARELAAVPEGADRIDALVDLAWRNLASPAFWAALELWTAARTDATLRDALMPVEKEIFAQIDLRLREMLAEEYGDDPRVPTLVQLTIDVLTGLVMSTVVSGDVSYRELLLRRWKRALEILLGRRDPDTLVERTRRPR